MLRTNIKMCIANENQCYHSQMMPTFFLQTHIDMQLILRIIGTHDRYTTQVTIIYKKW